MEIILEWLFEGCEGFEGLKMKNEDDLRFMRG
jgi:hypothetical protein